MGLPQDKWAEARNPNDRFDCWRRVGDGGRIAGAFLGEDNSPKVLLELDDGHLVECFTAHITVDENQQPSKFKLAAGSTVLNQDPSRPLSGTVIEAGDVLIIEWCNGLTSHENPSDVTLTGACVFEGED